MSLRPSAERDEFDEISSLLGTTSLGTSAGALWSRLSGSPVLRASSSVCLETPPSISSNMSLEDMLFEPSSSAAAASSSSCSSSLLPLPLPLLPTTAAAGAAPAAAAAAASAAAAPAAAAPPPVVESCIYLSELPDLDHDATFAFAHFCREDDETAPFVHEGVAYTNWDPVHPKPVYFDKIAWSPAEGDAHAFSFRTDDGCVVATLCATLCVHDAAAQGGMEALERLSLHVDDRTLKFHSPSSHLRKLEALLSGPTETDTLYLPLAEVVVGSAALRASRVLVNEADRDTPAFASAERAWMSAVDALERLSATVLRGCERHNRTELAQHPHAARCDAMF